MSDSEEDDVELDDTGAPKRKGDADEASSSSSTKKRVVDGDYTIQPAGATNAVGSVFPGTVVDVKGNVYGYEVDEETLLRRWYFVRASTAGGIDFKANVSAAPALFANSNDSDTCSDLRVHPDLLLASHATNGKLATVIRVIRLPRDIAGIQGVNSITQAEGAEPGLMWAHAIVAEGKTPFLLKGEINADTGVTKLLKAQIHSANPGASGSSSDQSSTGKLEFKVIPSVTKAFSKFKAPTKQDPLEKRSLLYANGAGLFFALKVTSSKRWYIFYATYGNEEPKQVWVTPSDTDATRNATQVYMGPQGSTSEPTRFSVYFTDTTMKVVAAYEISSKKAVDASAPFSSSSSATAPARAAASSSSSSASAAAPNPAAASSLSSSAASKSKDQKTPGPTSSASASTPASTISPEQEAKHEAAAQTKWSNKVDEKEARQKENQMKAVALKNVEFLDKQENTEDADKKAGDAATKTDGGEDMTDPENYEAVDRVDAIEKSRPEKKRKEKKTDEAYIPDEKLRELVQQAPVKAAGEYAYLLNQSNGKLSKPIGSLSIEPGLVASTKVVCVDRQKQIYWKSTDKWYCSYAGANKLDPDDETSCDQLFTDGSYCPPHDGLVVSPSGMFFAVKEQSKFEWHLCQTFAAHQKPYYLAPELSAEYDTKESARSNQMQFLFNKPIEAHSVCYTPDDRYLYACTIHKPVNPAGPSTSGTLTRYDLKDNVDISASVAFVWGSLTKPRIVFANKEGVMISSIKFFPQVNQYAPYYQFVFILTNADQTLRPSIPLTPRIGTQGIPYSQIVIPSTKTQHFVAWFSLTKERQLVFTLDEISISPTEAQLKYKQKLKALRDEIQGDFAGYIPQTAIQKHKKKLPVAKFKVVSTYTLKKPEGDKVAKKGLSLSVGNAESKKTLDVGDALDRLETTQVCSNGGFAYMTKKTNVWFYENLTTGKKSPLFEPRSHYTGVKMKEFNNMLDPEEKVAEFHLYKERDPKLKPPQEPPEAPEPPKRKKKSENDSVSSIKKPVAPAAAEKEQDKDRREGEESEYEEEEELEAGDDDEDEEEQDDEAKGEQAEETDETEFEAQKQVYNDELEQYEEELKEYEAKEWEWSLYYVEKVALSPNGQWIFAQFRKSYPFSKGEEPKYFVTRFDESKLPLAIYPGGPTENLFPVLHDWQPSTDVLEASFSDDCAEFDNGVGTLVLHTLKRMKKRNKGKEDTVPDDENETNEKVIHQTVRYLLPGNAAQKSLFPVNEYKPVPSIIQTQMFQHLVFADEESIFFYTVNEVKDDKGGKQYRTTLTRCSRWSLSMVSSLQFADVRTAKSYMPRVAKNIRSIGGQLLVVTTSKPPPGYLVINRPGGGFAFVLQVNSLDCRVWELEKEVSDEQKQAVAMYTVPIDSARLFKRIRTQTIENPLTVYELWRMGKAELLAVQKKIYGLKSDANKQNTILVESDVETPAVEVVQECITEYQENLDDFLKRIDIALAKIDTPREIWRMVNTSHYTESKKALVAFGSMESEFQAKTVSHKKTEDDDDEEEDQPEDDDAWDPEQDGEDDDANGDLVSEGETDSEGETEDDSDSDFNDEDEGEEEDDSPQTKELIEAAKRVKSSSLNIRLRSGNVVTRSGSKSGSGSGSAGSVVRASTSKPASASASASSGAAPRPSASASASASSGAVPRPSASASASGMRPSGIGNDSDSDEDGNYTLFQRFASNPTNSKRLIRLDDS